MQNNRLGSSLAFFMLATVLIVSSGYAATETRLLPGDFLYLGAFRLPDVAGDCDWTYSGHGMTYYPDGDAAGPQDGYPGSLYATGNDSICQFVSEIAIPVPVKSATKNLAELNTATTLQPFQDIRNNIFGPFGDLIIPRAGLAYLPPQGAQTTGKLHFCWAQHIQDFEVSHGWSELNLSAPQTKGAWYIGSYTNYVTNDYLLEIPVSWANANTPGLRLATGRAREGPWAGLGPALFAYGPWLAGNPPAPNVTINHIKPLLLYGVQTPGVPEITTDPSMAVNDYQDSDHWYGAEWLTSGDKTALIFIGTKALGSSWYGFADGTVWPYDCAEPTTPPCPVVPDWPNNDRGFWADDYTVQVIFYDPDDLAKVANGTLQPWQPQPFASLDLAEYFYDPNIDPARYKRDLVGAIAYDRAHNLLYVTEKLVDSDKSIIHVFGIKSTYLVKPGTQGKAPVGSYLLLLDKP